MVERNIYMGWQVGEDTSQLLLIIKLAVAAGGPHRHRPGEISIGPDGFFLTANSCRPLVTLWGPRILLRWLSLPHSLVQEGGLVLPGGIAAEGQHQAGFQRGGAAD